MHDEDASNRIGGATKPTAVTPAAPSAVRRSSPKPDAPREVGAVVQLVKDYARQETLGPLRGAGRWLAFGAAGALLLGLAGAFFVLGVLRLVQTEFAPTFRGQWMRVVPYVIALVTAVLVIALAVTRIGKKPLQKEKS